MSERSRKKGVYWVSSLDFGQAGTGLKMMDMAKKLAADRALVLTGSV